MKSESLNQVANVVHDFGTREAPKCPSLSTYFETRPTKKQVHATRIAIATHSEQNAGEADGWYTEEKGLLLSVVNADCYPILLSRSDGSAVAALHVGWRGAYHGMIKAFHQLLQEKGDHPSHWIAAVGPGAKACCYEVSESLIDDFAARYPIPRDQLSPSFRKLELPTVIDYQLKAIGIQQHDFNGLCTICTREPSNESPMFYSYRRDHTKDVQSSVIMISDQ